MRIEYRTISLRPYPGGIRLFRRLDWLKAHFEKHAGEPYPYKIEPGGGCYVTLEGKEARDRVWLIYASKPHTLAHELTHVLLTSARSRASAHPPSQGARYRKARGCRKLLDAFGLARRQL